MNASINPVPHPLDAFGGGPAHDPFQQAPLAAWDPLPDPFDALEQSIAGQNDPWADPYADSGAALADQLEASIEGSVVPVPIVEAPELPLPLPEQLLPGLPGNGPPVPTESFDRLWDGGLLTPEAARPFFMPEGLQSPDYRPRVGGSTGIRHQGDSAVLRWCEEIHGLVDVEACQDCDQWDDHLGNGYEECRYDHVEEGDDEKGSRDGYGHEE